MTEGADGPPSSGGEAAGLSATDAATPGDLPPDVVAQIEAAAVSLVERIAAADPGSSEFRQAIAAIDGIGDREVRTTTQIVAAFDDRPARAVVAILAERAPLRRNLDELRAAATSLGRLARNEGASREDVAEAVRRAEERIGRIVLALDADRQLLEVDNAALAQHERALWSQIRTLRRYVRLAARIDERIDDLVDDLQRRDAERARILRGEALHAARRRHRDLLLQLAVASQGYAALRLIEQDNLDVIWALRSASTTTVTALRTALLVAQTVADRRLAGAVDVAGHARAWTDVLDAVGQVDARRRRTLSEAAIGVGGRT